MGSQVKTKERVRQHGEVFTAEREVMAMMDLVKEDASNIDSTFFEPACGDGNFLAEILSRKMRSVFKVALSNDADCEYWATLTHLCKGFLLLKRESNAYGKTSERRTAV